MSSYILIGSTTLSSSQSSVTFSSIPTSLNSKNLRDLIAVVEVSGASSSEMRLNLNGLYATNSYERVNTISNSLQSFTFISDEWRNSPGFSTTKCLYIFQFIDFAQSKHKTVLMRSGVANNLTGMAAYRWTNTAAISSMIFDGGGVNFDAGSTFSLYGIEG